MEKEFSLNWGKRISIIFVHAPPQKDFVKLIDFRNDPSNRNLDKYLQTWETFLLENRQFIEHFDFIRQVPLKHKIFSGNCILHLLEKKIKLMKISFIVRDLAVEDPGDSPVIMAKYRKIFLSFLDNHYTLMLIMLNKYYHFSRFGSQKLPQNTTSFLPFFGTDFGLCSVIKPQVNYCSTL